MPMKNVGFSLFLVSSSIQSNTGIFNKIIMTVGISMVNNNDSQKSYKN